MWERGELKKCITGEESLLRDFGGRTGTPQSQVNEGVKTEWSGGGKPESMSGSDQDTYPPGRPALSYLASLPAH